MTRSHKTKGINGGTKHRVSRKVGFKPLTEKGKQSWADGMQLKQRGYGALDELEQRLAAIKPKDL